MGDKKEEEGNLDIIKQYPTQHTVRFLRFMRDKGNMASGPRLTPWQLNTSNTMTTNHLQHHDN